MCRADVREASLRIFLQTPPQQSDDRLGRADGQRAPVRILPQHRDQLVPPCLAFEGPAAGQQLVEHAAEGPDVRPRVERLAARLLRAHVGHGAEDRARLGLHRLLLDVVLRSRRLDLPGDAEVEHLDLAAPGHVDVGRLQVAVDHAALVGRLQRRRDLPRDGQRFVDRQRPLAQLARQVLAMDQLHGQEAGAFLLVQPVDGRDVGMVDRGQQLGLALEAGQPRGVGREFLGKDLDRHLAVQRGVDRLPDHAHPALADLFGKAVVEQHLARFEGHRRSPCPVRSARRIPLAVYPGAGARKVRERETRISLNRTRRARSSTCRRRCPW